MRVAAYTDNHDSAVFSDVRLVVCLFGLSHISVGVSILKVTLLDSHLVLSFSSVMNCNLSVWLCVCMNVFVLPVLAGSLKKLFIFYLNGLLPG